MDFTYAYLFNHVPDIQNKDQKATGFLSSVQETFALATIATPQKGLHIKVFKNMSLTRKTLSTDIKLIDQKHITKGHKRCLVNII